MTEAEVPQRDVETKTRETLEKVIADLANAEAQVTALRGAKQALEYVLK